jgi:acyl-CoA reductase-like NAD-dependent aldehyde dehydrogenase
MNYSAMADPATPTGGFNAFGYGRDYSPGGPDDFPETQSVLLDSDLASENCSAL